MKEARIPSSTYRLQFHAGFTFRDAREILGYLDALGISDVYASPYFQASPDSTHGYDVANHNRLNPAIGDATDFRAFVSDLRERKMGHLLDFVPNHMGIGQSLNAWWMGVLEEGIDSPYAKYFDIDWHPGKEELARRVLLPVLGDRYGKVLENGDFKLSFEEGAFFLLYFETRLPISLRTYPMILRRALARLDESFREKLEPVIEACASRNAAAEVKSRLRELPEIRPAVEEIMRRLEGEPGKVESFDALHDLLEGQNYRLSYWRVAAEEINYRRFFDINTLAAIRIEIPEVFEAAHGLVFELLARGDVTGLRIDHIDGLWDPRAYLARLQERYAQIAGGESLYLVVEKILDPTREQLPEDWRCHGTTGYEFADQVVQLLVDGSAARHMTKTYEKFTGLEDDFADIVYEKKNLTMQIALSSEVATLGRMLDELSEMHRNFRDLTRNTLTAAIREVIACFPVYRTYTVEEGKISPDDEKIILRAVVAARRRNPTIDKSVFDFLRGVLLLRLPERLTPAQREAHVRFVMKFQQCSGPVTAKGLEDTTFYIFNRLVALNEVGGNPGLFGIAPKEFHRLCAERRERLPHTLVATSTHDTKRSEDVRMRIAALSEMPGEWRDTLKRWGRLNKKLRTKLEGDFAPSRNEEYLLYQTLLGSWPLGEFDRADYISRIQQYMTKALKEAKINSSWTEPNEEWEKAVSTFIEQLLDPETSAEFLAEFTALAGRLAALGAMNSLTQLVLKSTTPGVPDFYQGSEIWDLSLVDPDNRRPVDYALRRSLLASLDGADPAQLLADWTSGRIKLHLSRQLLRLRREQAEFFREADYCPVAASGPSAEHLIAFARSWNNHQLLVVVPRLTSALGDFPIGEKWAGTTLLFDLKTEWKNILTGKSVQPTGENVPVGELLGELPLAVLYRSDR